MEEGEECDCGWEEDCKDSCCYPMSSAQSALACKLKPKCVYFSHSSLCKIIFLLFLALCVVPRKVHVARQNVLLSTVINAEMTMDAAILVIVMVAHLFVRPQLINPTRLSATRNSFVSWE